MQVRAVGLFLAVLATLAAASHVWAEGNKIPIRIVNLQDHVWQTTVWVYPEDHETWSWTGACDALGWSHERDRRIEPTIPSYPEGPGCGRHDRVTLWVSAWNKDTREYVTEEVEFFKNKVDWGAVITWTGRRWECVGCFPRGSR